MSNLFTGSSNLQYHNDTTHLSSSGLKLLLQDPAAFKHRYIDGNVPHEEDKPWFLEGTLTHSLILEDHKFIDQYAVYPGLRKQGKVFEEFRANNASKTVISVAQLHRAEKLYKAYANNAAALELIAGGFAEHSMVGSILGVPVKSRADYINVDKGYIADVKTTINPTDVELFRLTVESYRYDLSAALYCDIAYQTYGKIFTFYFIVLSKSDGGCAVYKMSSDTLQKGAGLMLGSIVLYKKCKASGLWQLEQPKSELVNQEEILEV